MLQRKALGEKGPVLRYDKDVKQTNLIFMLTCHRIIHGTWKYLSENSWNGALFVLCVNRVCFKGGFATVNARFDPPEGTTGSTKLYDGSVKIAKLWWDSPCGVGVDNGFAKEVNSSYWLRSEPDPVNCRGTIVEVGKD